MHELICASTWSRNLSPIHSTAVRSNREPRQTYKNLARIDACRRPKDSPAIFPVFCVTRTMYYPFTITLQYNMELFRM